MALQTNEYYAGVDDKEAYNHIEGGKRNRPKLDHYTQAAGVNRCDGNNITSGYGYFEQVGLANPCNEHMYHIERVFFDEDEFNKDLQAYQEFLGLLRKEHQRDLAKLHNTSKRIVDSNNNCTSQPIGEERLQHVMDMIYNNACKMADSHSFFKISQCYKSALDIFISTQQLILK